jgi:tetratricopeptide (TPR) repeat protein
MKVPSQCRILLSVLLLLGLLPLCCGCTKSVREHYTAAQFAEQDKDYTKALAEYEEVLKLVPDDPMANYGKAHALYELQRYAEAKPIFEHFLEQTYEERGSFQDVRYDAEFYRDKCKVALGEEVPQNQDTLPPPPMGE